MDKSSLRKLLFRGNPDYLSPSITIKQLVNKKSNIVEAALKKKISKDSVDAGHITVSIMFDGGSAKDKMKSKKHAVMIHWTMKDFEIRTDQSQEGHTVLVMNLTGKSMTPLMEKQ